MRTMKYGVMFIVKKIRAVVRVANLTNDVEMKTEVLSASLRKESYIMLLLYCTLRTG